MSLNSEKQWKELEAVLKESELLMILAKYHSRLMELACEEVGITLTSENFLETIDRLRGLYTPEAQKTYLSKANKVS